MSVKTICVVICFILLEKRLSDLFINYRTYIERMGGGGGEGAFWIFYCSSVNRCHAMYVAAAAASEINRQD